MCVYLVILGACLDNIPAGLNGCHVTESIKLVITKLVEPHCADYL